MSTKKRRAEGWSRYGTHKVVILELAHRDDGTAPLNTLCSRFLHHKYHDLSTG